MKTFGIGFAIGATLSPAVANAFSTVEQKIKATSGKMGQLQQRSMAVQKAMDLQSKSRELQKIYAASGGTDIVAGEALKKTVSQYRVAQLNAQKYGVSVGDYAHAHGKASKELALTEARLKSLNATKAAADKRQELRGRMVDAIVPAMALATPIRAAINFESAMADAAKTIDGMRDNSGNLTQQYYDMETAVKQMGRTLPLTHEEIAKLFAAGGQLGMTSVAELQEFATMSAHMSVAFGMNSEEAADAIGKYRTALNLTMPQTREMLDLMNQYANTGSASEKGIADIVRRIGMMGDITGVSHKPMTALAATLESVGVAPDKAATGIKNFTVAMTAGTSATNAQKKAFASLGFNDTNAIAMQMQKDGPAAIISVIEAIKRLPKHAQLSITNEIFGKESLDVTAALLKNTALLKENLIIAADTSAYAGAIQKEYENRSKTTANALILAKNKVSELGINLGSVLLPHLVSVLGVVGGGISLVAEFAQKHQTLTTLVMGAVTGFTVFKLGALAAAYGATFFGASTLSLGGTLVKIPSLMRLVGMGAHAMLGPFGLVTAAIALIAGYVVENWESIGPVVMGLWGDLKSAASDFGTCIDEVMLQPIRDLFTLVGKIPLVGDAFRGIGKMLGFGDDKKDVPVKPVMPDGYTPPAGTIAPQSVEQQKATQAAQQQAAGTRGPAPSTPSLPSTASPQQGSRQTNSPPSAGVSVTQHFSINGISDMDFAKRVIAALDARKNEVERLVSNMVNDAVRLAYGS